MDFPIFGKSVNLCQRLSTPIFLHKLLTMNNVNAVNAVNAK